MSCLQAVTIGSTPQTKGDAMTLLSRRAMMQATGAAAGLAAIGGTRSVAAAEALALKEGAVVLFQGDSITDAGRDRGAEGNANDPRMLGRGYPFQLAAGLLLDYPAKQLKIYNRGISGNKVPDLQARWQQDCLDLKPDVLSILIGVNDIWHKMAGRYDGTVDDYRTGFTALLEQTREALPETTFVICEPFALRCGAVQDSWYPEFDERRAVAAEVAEKAGALWVPFQSMFDEAIAEGTEPQYWAHDGVHPSIAGHALMAKTWRKVVGI